MEDGDLSTDPIKPLHHVIINLLLPLSSPQAPSPFPVLTPSPCLQPLRRQNNLKMSKERPSELSDSLLRRHGAKSTDLKRRLFEVGLAVSPPAVGITQTIASPKRLLARHAPSFGRKEEEHLLKFQPSHSPQLAKTGKDFQIRKSPKAAKSSTTEQSHTFSNFYKPDAIRDDPPLPLPPLTLSSPKSRALKTRLLQNAQSLPIPPLEESQSRLDEYVRLVLRGVDHIDEFLYLVRGREENIYQLQLVDFEVVRQHQGETGFEYYTVSKKGFCQYMGGKPHAFLDIAEWAEEKTLYLKIKALKFFYRFRRWKTLQMWRRTITKQRREAIAHSLADRLFLLEPTARTTLLQLRKLTLEMERSVLIIAKNEGAYTLESFKHCQERARREASLAVEEYSRESRAVVRKCFEGRLAELRENIKRKAGEEKASVPHSSSTQSPKESAFQALGFPSKMSYQHRSRLRKEAGRFLRFSYLVDSLHLSCLAGLYAGQVAAFIARLQEAQIQEGVRLRAGIQDGKEDADRERMFVLQLACNFKDVPPRIVAEGEGGEEWSPLRDIRLRGEERGGKPWVPRLCEHWLSMQPALDDVLDELSFLLREGLGSLKCFQRWARHRQMQKYVSILEEWDDLVSENWEISENDNLDPLLLLDSLDPALSKLKLILKTTENKLLDAIRNTLTDLLNSYWHYSQLPLDKLESQQLLNPAETFEQFLLFTTKLLEKVTNDLPHRIELGVVTVQVTRIKTTLGQKFAGVLESLRGKLPELVEERTALLNGWLTAFGGRLREEILNIDDFVRVVGVIREVEGEFGERREECNELAQLYQTMQVFRMDTRRRKEFQTVTLKLKDQLEQLLITAEQNIERKADLYTKEVLKYHLPTLVRDINKALENVEQPRFLRLDSYRSAVKDDLAFLQSREQELQQQRGKCDDYMTALKIQGQSVGELNELSRQIMSRVDLWRTLEEWEQLSKEYQGQSAKILPLGVLLETVEKYRDTLQRLEEVLPPNQILQFLKQSVKEWHIYLPLLSGFAEPLSDTHWSEIYEALPEKYGLDLKRREFSLMDFLRSGIGSFAREVQAIFEKCRVEAQLQRQYQSLEDSWLSLLAKIRAEGRFTVIANGEALRGELDAVVGEVARLLANPHAQSLKQYSITYESVFAAQEALEGWLRVQERIVEVEKQCRLLDIKKLPDYNYFQNAERLYKQASKAMTNKGAEAGVRLGKLLTSGVEEKLAEIQMNLAKVEENIRGILRDHRRIFPSFYLFSDAELLRLITQQSHQSLQWAARRLFPAIGRLQFQNERISAIITIDQDRLIKNPISVNSEVEQILFQIGETCCQLSRRALRACRYKAVENNLSSLAEQYNIQHLLAISRVDFSHYTTISIDNQQDTPDSLSQFRKVMRKDTAEDIRTRSLKVTGGSNEGEEGVTVPRKGYLQKYDTLLLQQLLYEEILDFLIKSNVQRSEDYPWASQLKFFWEDTPSDDPNITVKQLHLALKYGSEFVGSRSRVVLQSEAEGLLGLRLGEYVVYNGSRYNLQRLANAVGYKVTALPCNQLTTEHALRRFLIGCHFADFLPFLLRADQLPPGLLAALPDQKWVEEFKGGQLKRNSPYLREAEKGQAVFLNVREATTGWQALQARMRVVHYLPPRKELLRCGMRLRGVFSEERTSLLLRVFEAVGFLEERSRLQGVSLEQFLDDLLQSGEEVEEHSLFERVLCYLQPKITLEAHAALTKHVQSLALLPFNDQNLYSNKSNNKLDAVFECLQQRTVLILTGRGHSKKYFIKKEAEKRKMQVVQLSAEGLTADELFGCQADGEKVKIESIFAKFAAESDQKLLYFEAVTPQLLLALESLLFSGETPSSNTQKLKVLLDIPSPQKFITPRQLTTFPTLSFESPRECVNAVVGEWLLGVKEEEKRRAVSRVLFEIILPTLENLSGKEELLLQERTLAFLNYLSGLGSFKNPLEAAIYTLVTMFRGCEEQQLKLQYLVKKHLGEEKLGEGVKIGNLFYRQSPLQDKLITDKEYLRVWMEENEGFRDDSYLLTPALLHALTITRRAHENTELPVFIHAPANAGKTALFALYRRLHHENSFYMQVSPAEGRNWSLKLTSSLQRHGLGSLGARINYRQSVILVEDVHLAERGALLPLELMLFYGRCRLPQKEYQLRNVKFMLSGENCPENLQRTCLRVALETTKDELAGIFTQLLKRNAEKEWDLNELLLQKIANSTLDVCLKVVGQQQGQTKEAYAGVRRVLAGFGRLKIKEGLPVQKEIEKFWAFALLQALKPYDRMGELEGELRRLDLYSSAPSILSFTHLCFKNQRKVEPLKDPKRLYNLLNEKIEKYNESDTKRYGESFQFINFDAVLEKMVTISHSLLLDTDHLLVGRRGTGKEALVKLAAFFNGLFYRGVKGSIKSTLLQLIDGSSSAPHLLYKSIATPDDALLLHEYAYCDFQSEILSRSEGKPRAGTREKEKTVHMKSIHKNMVNTDTYVVPKAKLTCEEVGTYRRAFRLVAAVTSLQQTKTLSAEVRSKFHLDIMEEVPSPSIMQYNEKLLSVDGVTCSRDTQLLLSQIFQHSRQALGLSLRSNDDCVRLFSSFLANLVNEMVLEEERYCKVLDLLTRLNNCYALINQEVARLHGKLKEISLNTEGNKEVKMEIQTQLREKSTAQSVSQKLTEILTWLQPLYSSRLAGIKLNLDNRQSLEMTFALTASYFIYLSNTPYEQRRNQLSAWYRDIPLLAKVRPVQSFLSLFLLYEEEFNAEPVDHLPQFYENMSIIFHSAKPIAIRDISARGRLWLQKNCSFLYLKEEQKDFLELIKESLGKSSNILIEVSQQETLDHISESLVGTLLFLPESVGSVTVKGEEVQIHPESKVYLLLKEGLRLPKELQQEFTVVLFEQSQSLAKTALIHEFLSHTQREPHLMKLDFARKIRSLRLDCENAIGQVADSIYEQLCGNDLPPEEHTLVERLGKITDKLMVRAQNQFTKIREKEELMRDLQEKMEKAEGKIVFPPAERFYAVAKGIRKVLTVMAQASTGYNAPSYAEYFTTLRVLLSKGTVSSVPSLILAALRQWGPVYRPQHYQIFAFLLVMTARGRAVEDFLQVLTDEGIRGCFLLGLLGKEGEVLQREEDLPEVISSALIELFREEEFRSIGPLISAKETSDLPLLWKGEQGQNSESIRVVCIRGATDLNIARQRVLSVHPKLLEPSEDDTLEALLKKTPHEEVEIFVSNTESLKEAERVIKAWSLIDKATVFLYNPKGEIPRGSKQIWWEIEMGNDQTIFGKVVEFYLRSVKVQAEERQAKEGKEGKEEVNQAVMADPPALTFTGLSFTHHSDHCPPTDPLLHLLQKFTACLQWKYESLSLPSPSFSPLELRLFRKSIDSDNPMTLPEKLTLMLQSLHAVLHTPASEVTLYAKTLESRLIKLTTECFTDEEFYKEAESALAEGEQLEHERGEGERSALRLQLGWLIKTRAFFGLSNEEMLNRYLKEVEECISSCLIYNEAPKVTRGSKRQPNIKNRRESMNKKPVGRESQSLGKRLLLKTPSIRVVSSPLASLYLLKETEYFQQILYKIHRDLQRTRSELYALPSTPLSQKSLTILLRVLADQPIGDWKCMLFEVGCVGGTLSLSMRSIMARRNELFTYYSKFSISESCELDFRYIRHPAELLRAYFRSELNNQDTFMLTTVLTVEEAERGEYLRVNGMWGQGWRLTPEGVIENTGENKPSQLSGCFIVKKIGVGVGMNAVDLLAAPEDKEPLMRVYAMSKKSQGGPPIKLYLRVSE